MNYEGNQIDKEITKEWQGAFPQLATFEVNKLYKAVGPLVLGLELTKLPRSEGYRPHLMIYGLWGNRLGSDLKSALLAPILIKEFYNKKGLQLSIPYTRHKEFFAEAVEGVKTQLPFALTGDVSLKALFNCFEEYSRTPMLAAAPNSYLQANLCAIKMRLALYVDDQLTLQHILQDIESRRWDMAHFAISKVDYTTWITELRALADDRQNFVTLIENNRRNKKILKLPFSELTT